MQFEVTTHFAADYRPPRSRTRYVALLLGSVTVDITEIDHDDAPIVHVIGEDPEFSEGIAPYLPFRKQAGLPVEVRLHGGDYFVRRIPVDGLQEALAKPGRDNPFNAFSYAGTSGTNVAAGLSLNENYETAYPRNREEFEETQKEKPREWNDRFVETVHALERRAEDLAIIDGHLYEKVGEPVLVLSVGDSCVSLRLAEAETPGRNCFLGNDCFDPSTDIRFGLDELERAISEGEHLASMHGCYFVNQIEIRSVAEWAVNFRGEAELLFERAVSFLNESKNLVPGFDAGTARPWHDLLAALSHVQKITVPAIEAIRSLCAADEITYLQRHTNYGGERMKIAFSSLKEALRLWDEKSAHGLEWTEIGLGATAAFGHGHRITEITSASEALKAAAKLGTDLTGMASDAAAGKGAMLSVETPRGLRGVCFVRVDEDEPRIVEAVMAHETQLAPELEMLVLDHYREARAARDDFAALEELGI